jgi:hypothetical protein
VHNIKLLLSVVLIDCHRSSLDKELNSEPPKKKEICPPAHLAGVVLTTGWVGASPLARSEFATCRTPTLRATAPQETASAAPFGTPGFLARG